MINVKAKKDKKDSSIKAKIILNNQHKTFLNEFKVKNIHMSPLYHSKVSMQYIL